MEEIRLIRFKSISIVGSISVANDLELLLSPSLDGERSKTLSTKYVSENASRYDPTYMRSPNSRGAQSIARIPLETLLGPR